MIQRILMTSIKGRTSKNEWILGFRQVGEWIKGVGLGSYEPRAAVCTSNCQVTRSHGTTI